MASKRQSKTHSIRILLIEDHIPDAIFTQELLNSTNPGSFDITHCTDLRSAQSWIEKSFFDAIILDLSLPDSTDLAGLQLLHDLVPTLPIVVITGLENEQRGIEAIRLGAQDYFFKGKVDPILLSKSLFHSIERNRTAELSPNLPIDRPEVEKFLQSPIDEFHKNVLRLIHSAKVGGQLEPIVSMDRSEIVSYEFLLNFLFNGEKKSSKELIPLIKLKDISSAFDLKILRSLIDHSLVNRPWHVQISGLDFFTIEFQKNIKDLLSSAPFPLEDLCIEIPESNLDVKTSSFEQALIDFRSLKVKLCLGHFGLGESSLRSLQILSNEFVRIDPGLIKQLTTNSNSLSLIKAVITLAHSLGRKVVAEGLALEEQWDGLASLGCDYVQGPFLHQRPTNLPQNVVPILR